MPIQGPDRITTRKKVSKQGLLCVIEQGANVEEGIVFQVQNMLPSSLFTISSFFLCFLFFM